MPTCHQLHVEYEHLQTLAHTYGAQLEAARSHPDKLHQAKFRKHQLAEALLKLETAVLMESLHLPTQYEQQHQLLTQATILETLPSGELGITGIDGESYPLPTYQEIQERIKTKQEILSAKAEQGFSKLLLVPFGMSLDSLRDKYQATIMRHHEQGKLLATKKQLSDPDTPLELDTNQPLYTWEKYTNADREGKLVYYPKEFSDNHQGKTKAELLTQEPNSGWHILLIEDLPNIPRENKGVTINNRPQLEASKTPQEYLTTLQQPSIYHHEIGQTPEDQLTYAITHLEATNQVIDDYQGKGVISYQTAAYFPQSGFVPFAYWFRGRRQASLAVNVSDRHDDRCGARAAVRV